VLGSAPVAGGARIADNAIIEVQAEVTLPRPKGQETAEKRAFPIGLLPAIPFEVVRADGAAR
jgi:hypothetical protein